MTQFWERLSRTEGDYIFERGDNIESYLNATGCSHLRKYMDTYKIHVSKHGGHMFIKKRFGDFADISNTVELEVESPYFSPGEDRRTKI